MRTSANARGLTVVELIVLMAAAVLCLGLLVSCVADMRRPKGMAQCASNMRQLGLALECYNADYRVLPSVHRNIWSCARDYLFPRMVSREEAGENAPVPDVYRCPKDGMLTDERNGCSYAPNYEVVHPFAAEPGGSLADSGDARNGRWSPFSNYKLTADANETPVQSGFLGTRGLIGSAPSTVLLIEQWDPENLVFFSNHKGLKAQPPIVEDGSVQCPRAPLDDYNGPAAGKTVDGKLVLPSTGQWTWGTYLSLRSFAKEARAKGQDIEIDKKAYHAGRINVLFCDQHVESLQCSRAFKTQIVDTSREPIKVLNPIWTRTED